MNRYHICSIDLTSHNISFTTLNIYYRVDSVYLWKVGYSVHSYSLSYKDYLHVIYLSHLASFTLSLTYARLVHALLTSFKFSTCHHDICIFHVLFPPTLFCPPLP